MAESVSNPGPNPGPGRPAAATGSEAAAERILQQVDDQPTAEAAARALLAGLCAAAGWEAARLELLGGLVRRPLWHVVPGRGTASASAAAAERRLSPVFLGEPLRGRADMRWETISRDEGASFLFPIRAGEELIAAVECFPGEGAFPGLQLLELSAAVCALAAPILLRKPPEDVSAGPLPVDPLTGLASRCYLQQRAEAALESCRRVPQRTAALIHLALDRFRVINDGAGPGTGDEILRELGARLRKALRPEIVAARVGGDEFAVLLEALHDPGLALRTADRLQRVLAEPVRLPAREVYVSASVGVAFAGEKCASADDLLRHAATATNRAKSLGVGRRAVFDRAMHASALAALQLETDLRRAVDLGEVAVHYQPVVALPDGGICGFEALARWRHPDGGWIAPAVFIPAAEKAGLIGRLGLGVMRTACQAARLLQVGAGRPMTMSVNLSARQLFEPTLLEQLAHLLGSTGMDPSQLRLEVTESILVEHLQAAAQVLAKVRKLRIGVCMDDFGTGYSSLNYLHRLPIDTLKIDRSFITALEEGEKAVTIVNAIVQLGLELGLEVVAEGVETVAQSEILAELGCPHAQGFHFARPLGIDEACALVRAEGAATTSRGLRAG